MPCSVEWTLDNYTVLMRTALGPVSAISGLPVIFSVGVVMSIRHTMARWLAAKAVNA